MGHQLKGMMILTLHQSWKIKKRWAMLVLQSSEKQKQGWNYLHYDFIRKNACGGKWSGEREKEGERIIRSWWKSDPRTRREVRGSFGWMCRRLMGCPIKPQHAGHILLERVCPEIASRLSPWLWTTWETWSGTSIMMDFWMWQLGLWIYDAVWTGARRTLIFPKPPWFLPYFPNLSRNWYIFDH